MKACIKCGVVKALEDFPLRRSSGNGIRKTKFDGRRHECRACTRTKKVAWDAGNRGKIREYHERWKDKDPEKYRRICSESRKRHFAKDPEKVRNRSRIWYSENKEAAAAFTKAWHDKNPGYARRLYAKNPEAYREKARKQYADNPRASINRTMRHQLRRKMAMPAWLTAEQVAKIDRYYDWRDLISQETGVPHQVDHIVPIKGKTVCGLHVPWNLRVITEVENKSKNNRHPDDFYGAGRW